MRAAPDPPGSPVVEGTISSPSCLSATRPRDPPERRGKQGGVDRTKCQIKNSSPNLTLIPSRKSKIPIDGLKSSQSSGSGEAIVIYDSRAPIDSTVQEQEMKENPGALVTLDRRKSLEVSYTHPTTEERVVLKSSPSEYASEDMRRGFDHCYVTVPCKERLSVLFATLRRSSERKVIVICATWESAAFHAILFRQLEMLHVYEMHENMKDRDVAFAYDEFLYLYPGILFSSAIAMREFDIPPNVDYFVQYEPPMNPTEYIYRMSHAKIYRTSCHKAMLFLTPEESPFLKYFDHIENKELEARKVSEFQESVEKLVVKHSDLNNFAWKAFRAFMLAYQSHSHNDIYDHTKIDEGKIRKSFGEPHLPKHSSKHFASDNGATREKRETTGEKREGKECDGQNPKNNQWMGRKEKTWRQGGKQWTREEKGWKHTHKHL